MRPTARIWRMSALALALGPSCSLGSAGDNGAGDHGAGSIRVGAAGSVGSAAPVTAVPFLIPNGTNTGIVNSNFLFEPEVPMASLKYTPTWNEIEQLLDNPYRVTPCSALISAPPLVRNTPPNEQNFPSYCTSTALVRRPGFGVTLPPFLIDPLNYNPTTGEEMRLLNPLYAGGEFDATSACVSATADPCTPDQKMITVSSGFDRMGVGDTAIDYDSPIARDTPTCVLSTETPEGIALCGGDPGEPGYTRFGNLNLRSYSTPALPLPGTATPATSTAGFPLFDPDRGFIYPRTPANPEGGLRKPSLRIPEVGGAPGSPNFLANIDPNNVAPSNENDYVLDRAVAIQLGKALFWDMQVGSDGVQSCGTCHFHAGADNRTKNLLNPNHLGPQKFAATFDLRPPNSELTVADFPFHKLRDPEIAGDPACTMPIRANINPGVLENNFPEGVTDFTVCDADNIASDTNDVASSMGVHFGMFADIPAPGSAAFTQPSATGGVRAVLPDLRQPNPMDPIAGFAGTTGNEIRRVEPRNTPTLFGAAFNFDNFWDARARHDANGGSVFGAADPQSHVFVGTPGQDDLTATRQIIRFSSIASLATGPGLSEFEMSFQGRNWAKIGKKLLQGAGTVAEPRVTPLANQLVATTDSVLGEWSNQGGSRCSALPAADRSGNGLTAAGKPGLCISYPALIRRAFYPALWDTGGHLDGTPAPCTSATLGVLSPAGCDPFDGYVLAIAPGSAAPTDTNQFTQMEANFSLFFGLSIQLWATILVPDNTPFDQFLDQNPDAFKSMGEAGEAGLVPTLPMCTSPTQRFCVREVALFKRDTTLGGTRAPGSNQPDPLLGLDLFEGSNLSAKNPNFRSSRCGECHALPTLTDHTMPFTFKATLRDFGPGEFLRPGVEDPIEPLGRLRLISGFLLESEMNENGQDGVERRIINQSLVPNPVDGLAYPDGLLDPAGADGILGTADDYKGAGASFFDNGIYNIGVRPIDEDIGRGGDDAFGWPLSLATLLLKNLGGVDYEPGTPLPTFSCATDPCDPTADATGGLFAESSHDPQINPGFEGSVVNPLMPPYLAPWLNEINVGDGSPEIDEVFGGVNTITDIAILEGFLDTIGPFNPAGLLPEALNSAESPLMGTWPVANRVGRNGDFKAAQLREVELTGPYFHNGGLLTLRQVVDFYSRGGDFPITNSEHRDFNLVNQNIEVQSNLSEEEKVALVDFLLTLTDDRVRYERAPFDHPEVIVPLDGLAPDNTTGRDAMLTGCTALPAPEGSSCAGGMFRDVPAVGATGSTVALPNFLGIAGADPVTGVPIKRLVGGAAFCSTIDSQYCH
ncbi:MAG: Methylamine utilization protein mauG [Myxococcales bacterium]|nr:Methylamine utilization protein mauG [Myxococcales bacterium]